ncbi:MAG: DNA replication/repair protein RecF [Oscillospiraceae bacterium]|nr:DNA replication/repair protein RecF [Oscillospiraceae bacterium]
MNITKIELTAFRNLSQLSMEPCSTVNIIYGDNAQGKTNLMEALWLLSGARSFRGARDADLVSFGQENARVCAQFYKGQREQEAEIRFGGKKSAWLNGIQLDSAAKLAGGFCAVVFSPSHLGLIKDGPGERRKFLDTSICQLTPRYIDTLASFSRVLQQRNSLLKDISYSSFLLDTLDIWDEKLASLSAAVSWARERYARRLAEAAAGIYSGISMEKESFTASYARSGMGPGPWEGPEQLREAYREAIAASRGEDLRSGATGVGPHRDDLEILLDGKSARSFGSQGQQRSSVLALKLGEARCMREILGEEPVILLDDVMSELDGGRREYLLNHLAGSQIFITCCDRGYFSSLTQGKSFHMQGGEVLQCESYSAG